MIEDQKLKLLIGQAQAGDAAVQEYILQENVKLVYSIVHRFANRGYERDDLFQIGCIGLIKAIQRFDTAFNVKFSTYAVPMIIGEIRRFIRDDNPVKVSRSIKELAAAVYRAREELAAALEREPTIDEIAAKMLMPVQEIVAALEAMQPSVSLYEPLNGDRGGLLLDHLKVADNVEGTQLDKIALREGLRQLSPRERHIIALRYFSDRTQAQIAADIGISQVQVSRIEKQALQRLRQLI